MWILSSPLSQLIFVRGSEHDGGWGSFFMIALILTDPATYALFFAVAGELLKTQVSPTPHKSTMRIAALGLAPYFVMITMALSWQSGPQLSLVLSASLTIPTAIVGTAWASARQD